MPATLIIAATGHRPDKLGGHSPQTDARLRAVAATWLLDHKNTIKGVISGMALGWDMAVAEACVDVDLPFVAAVPFRGQEVRWPRESQARYRRLLHQAHKVVAVCGDGYSPEKMQHRNEWMVDRADMMLALWDGSSGGTANCLRYAGRRGVAVENVWKDFMRA